VTVIDPPRSKRPTQDVHCLDATDHIKYRLRLCVNVYNVYTAWHHSRWSAYAGTTGT